MDRVLEYKSGAFAQTAISHGAGAVLLKKAERPTPELGIRGEAA